MADELVNRIGIGVGLDGTESVLTELQTIKAEVRELVALSQSAPSIVARSNSTVTRETKQSGQDRLGQLIQADVEASKRANKEKEKSGKALEKEITRTTEAESKARVQTFKAESDAKIQASRKATDAQIKNEQEVRQARALSHQEHERLLRMFPPSTATERAIYEKDPDVYLRGKAAIAREQFPGQEAERRRLDAEIARKANEAYAKSDTVIRKEFGIGVPGQIKRVSDDVISPHPGQFDRLSQQEKDAQRAYADLQEQARAFVAEDNRAHGRKMLGIKEEAEAYQQRIAIEEAATRRQMALESSPAAQARLKARERFSRAFGLGGFQNNNPSPDEPGALRNFAARYFGIGGPGPGQGPGGPGNQPPGGGGTGGGRYAQNSIYSRGIFGYGGHGGMGSVLATTAAYSGVYLGIRAFSQLISTSVEAYKQEEAAEARLITASGAAGRAAVSNLRLAESIHAQFRVSQAVADDTVSAVQRMTAAAGALGKEQGLVRFFENLAAARGVEQKDVPKLIDEAANETSRFSRKYLNVSSEDIYLRYAQRNRERLAESYGRESEPKSLRELATGLTEYEKKQAVVQELQAQSVRFQDAFATRQLTIAGAMDRTRGQVDDLTASLGRFLLTNRTVTDLIERAVYLTEKVTGSSRESRVGTGPGGLLTGQDIRERSEAAAGAWGARGSRYLNMALANPVTGLAPAVLASIFGFNIDQQKGQSGTSAYFQQFGNLFQNMRRIWLGGAYDEDVDRNAQGLYGERRQNLNDLRQSGRLSYIGPNGEIINSDDARVNRRDPKTGQLVIPPGARLRTDASGQPIVSDEAEANERRNQALKRENDRERERQAAEKDFQFFMGQMEQALNKLDEVEKALPSIGAAFAETQARDNAFVKPFIQLETVVGRVREQWGGFSQEVQNSFIQQERTNAQIDIANQRIDVQVNAYKALSDAKRLELNTTVELNKAEANQVRIFQAQTDAAAKIPNLRLERTRLERGFVNPSEQRGEFYRTLRGLEEQIDASEGRGGRLGREQGRIADEALRAFAGNIPQNQLYSGDPLMKSIRHRLAQANSREIERLEQNVRDEQQRAVESDALIRQAEGQVDLIRRQGPEQLVAAEKAGLTGQDLERFRRELQDGQRKRLLAVTGALSDEEIRSSPGLRQARVEALKQEAQAQLEMEQRAQDARDLTNSLLEAIYGEIRANRSALDDPTDKGQQELAIRIQNNTRAEVTRRQLRRARENFNASQDSKLSRDAFNTGFYGTGGATADSVRF